MPTPWEWRQKLSEHATKWKTSGLKEDEFLGDNPFLGFVLTENAASWNDFLLWVDELKGSWCYRGQRETSWLLYSSLDRAVRVIISDGHSLSGYDHLNRIEEERDLLFSFQQQAHLYIKHLPDVYDRASWLALMQHYGVPTRLLDWTYSPYVALFFAFIDNPNEQHASVWAIDLDWLKKVEEKSLNIPFKNDQTRAEYLNKMLISPKTDPVVVKIDPFRMNDRMVAQQGFFLCNLFHKKYATYNQIFMSMIVSDVPNQPVIRQLKIEKSLRVQFLTHLGKMNVHSASLFPGLDGFGKSLKLDLEMKVANESNIFKLGI